MMDAQTQYRRKLIAAWLCPLALLVAAWNAGLQPLKRAYSKVSAEILKLDRSLQPARAAYSGAAALGNEEFSLDTKLVPLLTENIRHEDDIYMMLNLKLYDYARQSGLEVNSLERGFPAAANWIDKSRTGFNFKPFQVIIDARGEYVQICKFSELIENDNVFSTAAEVVLRTRDMKDYDVLLKIDWPILTKYARDEVVPTIKGF